MDFFRFLDYSVTPYHTVDALKMAFLSEGFESLNEQEGSLLQEGGAYIVERNGAIIAVRMPKSISEKSRFRIALAHTDFPALKIAPQGSDISAGVKTIHSEVYGSPLFTSWLDRDLGYAGLLAVEKKGVLESRLVRGSKLLRIPQLAIHLNRGVNQDGLKVNPQVDLDALWGIQKTDSSEEASSKNAFVQVLEKSLSRGEKLLDFDVQLFDAQPAAYGGLQDEWIYSGRLDNLSSCHAIAEAMLEGKSLKNDFVVAAFLNNEEVGSTTREGASGNFLHNVLDLIYSKSAKGKIPLFSALSDSFALSIDMAHAVHPNHPEKHDSGHGPILGDGIVLKTNAQKRYASDVMSSAKLRQLCEKAGVPLQVFICRNDMPCGSTVGPTLSASLGVPTVDIGEPMLSMHSIREMMAVRDHEDMITLIKTLYR